jgi:hypothetical protein
MNSTLTSKSFKSAPTLELGATMRELIAALPVVLFVNAVRTAFFGSTSGASARSQTAR